MMKTRKNILKTVGILIVGVLLGWAIFGGGNHDEDVAHDHSEAEERQIWTCSMHPQIRQSEPGDCPICGMDLIPLESEEAGGDPAVYQMSENAMKLANVTTIKVRTADDASKEIRLNGKVQVDERNAYTQSTHIPGRIEQLAINFTGESVNRGQRLATVYSPELVTAQEELLQAYRIRENQPELFEAAKEKLRNWRIGQAQIDQIISGGEAIERFPITSDVRGVVTEKMVDLGDYVERGMPIYEISDLSEVWILFDVYEGEMGWISEGSKVEYTVRSLPGRTFEGTIDFIDPIIDSRSRVARARIEVDNEDGRLKPEMFVSGVVKTDISSADEQEIIIPKSAVLWTGERSVVYVKEDSGFKLREVTLGSSLGDAYVVEEGLQTGEEIVSNGAFTVDAAVQLSGRPSMMSPSGGGSSTGHDHGDMGTPVLDQQEDVADYLRNNTYDFREEAPEVFQEQLDKLVTAYLNLKNALVEGDEEESATYSKLLLERAREADHRNLTGDAKTFWDEKQRFLIQHAELDLQAEDMEERRENFVFLSQAMIKTLAAFGLKDKEVYVDYCPMANNDKGAYWLSEVEEIRNPFMPETMLTCGEIRETIE